ncbi:autotransporter domain-containing protein [Desulfovibrio fairfieldensis]|uniref:Autotransporter domain-containing protein n=1 Tax=Desulfovibrio fairfieldensis TaxID=44742 RepID=A0A0X8JLN9_9BACT|nr:autotransporter domain-containing protein [Desulfovibrio fairfieldensis]AMD90977.1 hypothetical protein AXF13_13045 [Desulfovibrio fairfieldensis]
MLTKGAIGNLVNKYRAVLKKCGLLNVFGSLAVAGALVLGGAGLAVAAVPWGADQDVVIESSVSVTQSEQAKNLTIGGAGNSLTVSSSTGHLYVSGATTLNDGGMLTLNTGPHGLLGTTDNASEAADTWTGSFGMTGGKLEISSSQLQMDAVTISGGTANIAGRIGGGTNWDDGAMLVGGLNGAATTVSGGKITVGDYGQVVGGQVNISGGEVALGGDSGKAAILRSYGADNALTLTGNGKISVSASKYGVLTANAVNINGGTLDVKGNLTLAGALAKKQGLANALKASGDATVNQTGGTVAVAAGGALNINRGVEYNLSGGTLSSAGTLHVEGELNLNGNVALTDLTAGTGKVYLGYDPDGYGADQNGYAKIRLGTAENVTLATSTLGDKSDGKSITVDANGSLQVQNLTLTGDSLSINKKGRIKVNSLTLTPNAAQAFTLSSGQLMLKGEDGSSTLSVGGTGGLKVDGSSSNAELKLGEVKSDGTVNPGGSLNADITATGNNAKVTVNGGAWTLAEGKTLDIQGGALTVGGGTDIDYAGNLPAELDVSKGTLKTTNGVAATVENLGTLVASKDSLTTTTDWDNVGQVLTINGGGTFKVSGIGSITAADLGTLKTNLMTGNGLLDVADADISGVSGGSTIAYTDAKKLSNTTSDSLREATVTDVNGALSGAYAGAELQAGTTSLSVAANSTLQLSGANGGNIIADASDNAGALTVANTGTAILGEAGKDNQGTVGNVTLTGTGTLNAMGNGGASFITGDITAQTDGGGVINATGATLNAEAIGVAGTKVGTVNANSGTINAASINTDALTADNGIVKATGNITVTSAVTGLNNGTIHSTTGDVTLTAGASNASGLIEATLGEINAGSSSITAASGKSLNLYGLEKITAGAIEATSVHSGGIIDTQVANGNVTATQVRATTLKTGSGTVAITDGYLDLSGTGSNASSVGSLALDNAQAVVGDLTVTSAATIEGGSFTGNAVTLSGGGEISNGAQVTVDTLTGAGQTIKVGSDTDTVATSLTVNTLDMAGGSLLIDPAWTSGSNVMAVGDFDSGDIDVLAGVGQNSMLLIGSADANWLTSQVNAATNGAGLTRNGVDSVLGIYSSQTLDNTNGGIQVDGTKTNSGVTSLSPAANTADFSGKSLLVVNADAATGGNVALTATGGTLNLTDGAKLRIAGAKIGADYTVVDGFTTTNYLKADGTTPTTEADSTAWVGANLSTDSKLVHLEKSATGEYKGALTSAAAFMPKLDGELVKVVNNMALAGNTGTAGEMSETKGVRFLNRAISEKYLNNDAAAAVTIESAARMALVGAVPQMTMAASNAAGNAVTQRTSLAQPGGNAIQSVAPDGSMQTGASAGDAAKTGFAMWIMPLYQSSNGYGMKAGNFDMDFSGGLGGVAIGADYTFDNAIRAGITFNIGGGYATGSGDLNETTNNMNFWGIGAYAGWAQNNFGVTADVNYTSTYNKLEQDLPASMQMGKLKSDVTAYAISAGLRGEYRFETSVMDITPHVGVRYMSLNTDEYDVKSGGTLLKGDAINQSIWTFPVGVAFSKQIETGNGWHFKPSLDLAVIPAAGDIDARSDVRFTGTGTKAELDTQTMDYVSYMGGLGLEFGNDTTSLGVNYNIQLGAKSTAHGVFGTFRYEF